tara:strand:- start:349 stop:453 length:105 start_codon:yes stop_codon:yes gene_type:complete
MSLPTLQPEWKKAEINDLVFKANEFRHKAHLKED